MADVKITVRKNGPFRVEAPEGSIELVDADGNKYDLTGKTAFALCRCGGSVNKPYCDGTHSKIGFAGAESAVRARITPPSPDGRLPSRARCAARRAHVPSPNSGYFQNGPYTSPRCASVGPTRNVLTPPRGTFGPQRNVSTLCTIPSY